MKIGSVVEALGIPASTLRYYEKIALIRPTARISNSRRYDEEALLRLRFIQMAQAVGFSIEEIKQLLTVFSVTQPDELINYESVVETSVETSVESKLKEISQRITDLQEMKSALEMMAGCECVSLTDCIELGEGVKNQLNK